MIHCWVTQSVTLHPICSCVLCVKSSFAKYPEQSDQCSGVKKCNIYLWNANIKPIIISQTHDYSSFVFGDMYCVNLVFIVIKRIDNSALFQWFPIIQDYFSSPKHITYIFIVPQEQCSTADAHIQQKPQHKRFTTTEYPVSQTSSPCRRSKAFIHSFMNGFVLQ